MNYQLGDFRKVCLIGLDTITSAFALSLKRAGFTGFIYGVDEPPVVKHAIASGVVSEGGQKVHMSLKASDIIVLSRYCADSAERLATILKSAEKHSIVLDASAVKGHEEAVFQAAGRDDVHYVGFHIVQDQLRKPGEAKPSHFFFDGKAIILTPRTRKDYPAFKFIGHVLESSGSKTIAMSPQDFHKRLATLEFMPDLLDFIALETALSEETEEKITVDFLGERLTERLRRFASLHKTSWYEAVAGTQDSLDELMERVGSAVETLRTDLRNGTLRERIGYLLDQGEYIQEQAPSTSHRELIVITGGEASVKQRIAIALVGARIALGNLEEMQGKTNGAYRLRLNNSAERDRATIALKAAGIEVELTE